MHSKRLLVLLLVGLAACGEEGAQGGSAAAPSMPREVRFTASDFSFEGPATVEAGMVTFVLTNNGPNWHHLQLVKLPDGMTLQAFQEQMATMQPGTPPPAWFIEAGGVNPPGDEPARVTMMLRPGEYAVLCMVDTPDHVPHVFKGMIKALTVTPSSEPAAAMPPADLMLTLVDYAFSFSTPPTAGAHVIHVMNGASQAHEVAFFKLLPGKTVDDVMAWATTYEGPPPMVPSGGVPGIGQGEMVDVYVSFTAGDWLALCFLSDVNDGQPHLAHDMILPFHIS